jgi:hypothetical protein
MAIDNMQICDTFIIQVYVTIFTVLYYLIMRSLIYSYLERKLKCLETISTFKGQQTRFALSFVSSWTTVRKKANDEM